MKTILISDVTHRKLKKYSFNKAITMRDATELMINHVISKKNNGVDVNGKIASKGNKVNRGRKTHR